MESLVGLFQKEKHRKIEPLIFENILESIPLGLVIINPEGDIVFTNRLAHEILGYGPKAFQDQGWGELFFHAEKNIEFNQVVIDAMREKKVNFHKDVPYQRADSEHLQLSMTTSLLHEEGEIVGLVVLLADITEIHQAREREKTTLEEKNLLQMERAESLRNLALSVAHQIRNPVAAIGGFTARMLKKSDPSDPNRSYLKSILEGTKRLEEMVNAVRDYTGLCPGTPRRIHLSRVLNTVQNRLDQRAAECSKKIYWDIKAPRIEIPADPDLLLQALEEIFFNALESFTSDQGRIEIRVFRQKGDICLTVSDSGTGIPEEDRSYIFDPFFTTKPSGVGIGLCKADRIIKEHKGDLSVTSKPGKGTRVSIRLPG